MKLNQLHIQDRCVLFSRVILKKFVTYMTKMQNIIDFSDTICITLSNRMKYLHQLI